MSCYNDASEIGQVDSAMIALKQSVRFKLLGGYNLALIAKSFEEEEWLELTVSNKMFLWSQHLFLAIQV